MPQISMHVTWFAEKFRFAVMSFWPASVTLMTWKIQLKKSIPFKFDKDKAERVAKFIQLLPHTKGVGISRCPLRLNPGSCSVSVLCLGG